MIVLHWEIGLLWAMSIGPDSFWSSGPSIGKIAPKTGTAKKGTAAM
jgi:hypothetical protein